MSFSKPCTEVSVLSLEFPQVAATLAVAAAAARDEDPPDDTDTDDKSCTSYNDSCELVLISRLDRLLLFFPLSRLAVGWSSCCSLLHTAAIGCCRGTSVLSSCCEETVFAKGAVLTEPTDEDEGELTIRSKLSSVELIEVLLLN